ncbi:MAG: UDP-3-O-(3-hydroxymyristoyl)glucosamine N-acyltransferase [Balneola sp.]|nr:UDP-3-O-(3-hydroxymyristoyl)glucosamine N-acyltransferase [Balneola sp.]|tara:strand:- start:146545 stop:147447 length:903 start_codon:yes stop_codon:yes gene_type:complete
MDKFTLEDLKQNLLVDFDFRGNADIDFVDNVKSISEANEHSVVWCSPDREDKQELVEKTKAHLIICDDSIQFTDALLKEKGFFVVKNPKLAFTRLLRNIASENFEPGIHQTATIHPEAEIADSVYVGPNSYIGKCTIGENSILHGNNFVYDGTSIGNGVVIEAGAILGAEGFGLAKTDEGAWERFPHIGGLEIHDRVEIGAGTTIDRGTLDNTIIGEGTKISKSAHISHNVRIGKNCLITGCVAISGSTTIGDNVWISPNATILNKLTIGNNVFISMGATVTQDIKDNFQALGRKILPKT